MADYFYIYSHKAYAPNASGIDMCANCQTVHQLSLHGEFFTICNNPWSTTHTVCETQDTTNIAQTINSSRDV